MKPLPAARRGHRYLDATQKVWDAWIATAGALHWSPAEHAKAERLIRLLDELNRDPTDLRLAKEVRLGEQALGLATRRRTEHNAPAAPVVDEAERRERRRARAQRTRERTEAVMADIDMSVFPDHQPGETADVAEGRLLQAVLDDGKLTEPQRRECARYDEKQNRWHAEHIQPGWDEFRRQQDGN